MFSLVTMFNLLPSFRENYAFPWTWKLHSSAPEAACSSVLCIFSDSEIPVQSLVEGLRNKLV